MLNRIESSTQDERVGLAAEIRNETGKTLSRRRYGGLRKRISRLHMMTVVSNLPVTESI